MPAKIVAAPLLELSEEARRPVGLSCRIVDLIGIVEERAKAAKTVSAERPIEREQILLDRVGREVIDDEPFSARCRAFHELAVPCAEQRVKSPASLRRRPTQFAVWLNA